MLHSRLRPRHLREKVQTAGPTTKHPLTKRPVVKVAIVLLLTGGVCVAVLPRAWQETQRREAYLPQLEAMARRDPYDGRLFALLGGRQLEAGEVSEAAATLERALNAGEKTEPVWLNFAAAKAATGERRAPAYLRVAMRDLNTPGIAAAQARCAALRRDASPLAIAGAICPQGPEPLVRAYSPGSFLNGLVEWWGRQRPEQSGFATRQDWASEEPNDPQAQRLWAEALMQNRRLPEAAAALQNALALAPDSPESHMDAALLLAGQGQLPQAALQYVTCLKLRPRWLPALLGLGQTLLTVGLPATAANVYTEATQVAPDSADAWVGRGQAVSASAGYVSSLQAFQTATRLAPSRTDYYDTYSQCLSTAGRWGDAESVLRRRLAVAPADTMSHYLLGRILLHYNATPAREAEAKAQTEVALRLAPQYEPLHQQMADILLREGKPQEAIGWLQHQFDEVPGDVGIAAVAAARVNALLTLARADRQAGLTAQADRVVQQATLFSQAAQKISALKTREGIDPLNVGLRQRLAALYAQAGQSDQMRLEQQTAAVLKSSSTRSGQEPETLEAIVDRVLSPR